MSKVAEKKEIDSGEFRKLMVQEALGAEIPRPEAEKIADAAARLMERRGGQRARRRRYGARCLRVMEDGRKCKQKGWLGGEYCFQHDPETAELRKLAGRPRVRRGRPSQDWVTKGQEVEKLLDETLTEVQAGRMKPGQAYAVGYLAQLMLMARHSRQKEAKLDVKWFWDMVDLRGAFEYAEKKQKEQKLKEEKRKARKEKKAREAKKAAGSKRRSEEEGEEAERAASPSAGRDKEAEEAEVGLDKAEEQEQRDEESIDRG